MKNNALPKVSRYVGKSSNGALVEVSVRWDIPGGTVARWDILTSGQWVPDMSKYDLIWHYQQRHLSDIVAVYPKGA